MVDIVFPEINLDGVKGALIDLDDTLYSYEQIHPHALMTVYKKSVELNLLSSQTGSVIFDFTSFTKQYRDQREKVTGRLKPQGACRSRLLAFQALCEENHLPQPYQTALFMEQIYWDTFYEKMTVAPGALQFLMECQKRAIPVAVVSDMQAGVQIRKLQSLKILHLIHSLTTSEEVGVEKPDPRIFNWALHKIGIPNSLCIMIGDSFEKDVVGAKNLGIPAFQVSLSNRKSNEA